MSYKTDDLRYAVYARHGDMCSLSPEHHDSLGCASRQKANDYVLVSRFAYLMEAIDYAQAAGARGVHLRLRSRRFGSNQYDVSEYPFAPTKAEAIAQHVVGVQS